MHPTEEVSVQCPYCGAQIELLIDCTISRQSYIEDCQVCCRPISVEVDIGTAEELSVVVSREDE